MSFQVQFKAQGDQETAGQHQNGAHTQDHQNGVAHFRWLGFLAADKAGHLHHNPHQHDGSGLRGFTRQGHNPGENPFAALAGDHFIHVSNIGVDIPRNVVDAPATQTCHG
ncbi:hypothetical protein D3C72_1348490 [compost metagenome]